MSEQFDAKKERLLSRLLKHSMKTEGAAEIKGDYKGVPFFIIVATGASAGLMERYVRQGTLQLTPNDEQEPS
jgi:hypothetical protein